jgi:hypothetical protein
MAIAAKLHRAAIRDLEGGYRKQIRRDGAERIAAVLTILTNDFCLN